MRGGGITSLVLSIVGLVGSIGFLWGVIKDPLGRGVRLLKGIAPLVACYGVLYFLFPKFAIGISGYLVFLALVFMGWDYFSK